MPTEEMLKPKILSIKADSIKANPAIDTRTLHAVKFDASKHLKLMTLQTTMARFNVPTFNFGKVPAQHNQVEKDIKGIPYFKPTFKICSKDQQDQFGFRFIRTPEDTVQLSIECDLNLRGIRDKKALPLYVSMNEGDIIAGSVRIALPKPTIIKPFTRDMRLRFLVTIPPEKLEGLIEALQSQSSNARVVLNMEAHMNIQRVQNKPPTTVKPKGVGTRRPRAIKPTPPKTAVATPLVMPMLMLQPKLHKVNTGASISATRRKPAISRRSAGVKAVPKVNTKERAKAKALFLKNQTRISEDFLKQIKRGKVKPKPQPSVTFTKDQVISNLTLFFPESNPHFDEIFGDVQPEPQEALSQIWRQSEFGTFAPGLYPNTIYMIPHGLRINYNSISHLPDISPTLFTAEDDTVRVRLRIGLTPWYDYAKVDALRRQMHLLDSAFYMPKLVRNFTANLSLNIQTAFQENINILDEINATDLSMDSPFSITLDLDLEFYRFLTTLLTGPSGITGTLNFQLADLDETSNTDDDREVSDVFDVDSVSVPFALRLSELGDIPLTIELDSSGDSHDRPRQAKVLNGTPHPVRFGNVMVTAFMSDPNNLLPSAAFHPDLENSFPFALPPVEDATIVLAPVSNDENNSVLLWNNLELSFAEQVVELDPEEMLARAQELAPPGSLSWILKLTCPLFTAPTLPAEFEGLVAIEVDVEVSGRAAITHTLMAGIPEKDIRIIPSFQEFIDNAAQEAGLSYSYRTRTIYTTLATEWTQAQTGTSNTAFIFPTAKPV